MTKEEELKEWKKRIMLAQEVRKPYLSDWNYYEQIYDNNLWGRNMFGSRSTYFNINSPVEVNELSAIINNSILPRILFNYPIFDVEDVSQGASLSAIVYEVLALKLYTMLDMFFVLRQIVLDALLLGGGIHKTGMKYDVEVSSYNVVDEETTEKDVLPTYFNEIPISVCVSPKNFLWDYNVNSWNDKRWVAEEIIKPVDEVKKSGLYEHTRNLSGNLSITDYIPKTAGKTDKDKSLVRLIEIHDLVNGKILTISMTHDKFLQYEDDYGFEVYDLLEFTMSRPVRFWGKSIVQDIEQHLVRLALANRWMDEDLKDAGRKLYMADSSIGQQALKRLTSDESRPIIPIDGLTSMGSDPIREIRRSSNTFQWATVIGVLERQIRMLTGATMQERGVHEPGVETAAEATMLMQASEIRNNDRALLLSIFTQKIMTKMLMLASAYVRPVRIAELLGIPPEESWMIAPFDKMKLTVRYGSTAMEFRNAYVQKLTLLNNMFGDIVDRSLLMEKMIDALGLSTKDRDLINVAGQAGQAEQSVGVKPVEVPEGGTPF